MTTNTKQKKQNNSRRGQFRLPLVQEETSPTGNVAVFAVLTVCLVHTTSNN